MVERKMNTMKKTKIFLIMLMGFIFWNDTLATHLMGGNIGYDFIGTLPNGQKRYRIYLFIYRDCQNGQAPFDNPLPLAVFDASTNRCVQSLQVNFLNSNIRNVTPNISSNCPPNTLPSYCIEQGYYETTVDLPASTRGYHIVYERCCRNNAILNVAQSQGQTYTAFIPNTNFNNSSPRFSDVPVPFMCTNDTVTLNNSATDRDGDSLVYSFVHPYAGGSTGNPVPQYNIGDVLNPPQPITYNPTFSTSLPFGPTGYNFIDPISGITYYNSTTTGNYIVAVNINEFRNGVLISSTRRDIQFLVGNCPSNTPPRLSVTPPGPGQTNGSGQTNLTVVEGSLISFPITIRDIDSVYLSATGTLSNPAANGIAQPFPTLTISRGIGTVNGSFNWQTSCAHRRNAPYEFTIAAQDQGCPKKTSYFNYRVTVLKSTTATGIIGPNRLCEGAIDTFRTNGGDTSSYQWLISAGTILGGQGTNRLIVQMPAGGGNVQIRAIETSRVGCKGDTLFSNFRVNAKPSSASQANPNPACPGEFVILQALQVAPQNKYSWTPITNLQNPLSPTAAFMAFNNTSSQQQRLFQLTVIDTITGCSDSALIRFSVRPKVDVFAGNDTTVCPGIPFSTGQNFNTSVAYSWSEIGGAFSSNVPNPTFNFSNTTNSNINKTLVVAAFRNLDNCRTTDTIQITIRPNAIANAGPDIRICNDVSGSIGSSALPNHSYLWTPALGLNDSSRAQPSVHLQNSSNVPVTYPYLLTTNRNGCLSRDSVLVTVLNKPTKPIIQGNFFPCKNSTGLTYNVVPNLGSTYTWNIVGGTITQRLNTSITCNWGVLDTGFIIIQERDSIGCLGDPDSTLIFINRAEIDSLYGNPSVCPFIAGVQYWVDLDSGSTYQWSVLGGSIAGGQGTDTLRVNWGGPGNGWVKVIPTNRYGCVGDSVVKNVLKNALLITVPPVGDTDVCAGQDSTRYSVIPTTGSTYTWQVTNGLIIGGQGTPSILVRWPNSVGTGVVTVVERSSFPCEGTPVTTRVNIHPLPQRIPILGPDTLCLKVPGNFQLNGYPTSQFIWWGTQIDSNTILPRGSQAISASWKNFGIQILKVLEVTEFGCTLDTLRKNVFIQPEPSIIAQNDTTICSGTSLIIGQPSEPQRSYQWTPGIGLNDSTVSQPTFFWLNRNTIDDTLVYFRKVINTVTGCLSYDTFSIRVHPLPLVFAGIDTNFCTDFSHGLGELPRNGYRYLWQPSLGLNNDTISNPILRLNNFTDTLQSFPFIVRATEPLFGCSWQDTVVVGIKPLPKPWAGPDREVCSDDTVVLGIGQQPNVQYSWSPPTYLTGINTPQTIYQRNNPSQFLFFDSTVVLTATHQIYGCVKSDTVLIKVKPRPMVQAGPNVRICSEDSIGLGIPGNWQYSYQWSPMAGLSNPNISNPKFALANRTLNNQILNLILTANFTVYQCTASDTVEILLHPEPNTDSLRGPRLVCEFDSLSLYSLPLKVGSNYQFTVQGGSIISQLPGGQGWLIRWGGTGLGFINYQETDSNGCIGKWRNVVVRIAPLPFFKKIIGDTIICEPNITNVSYQIQNAVNTSNYQWFALGGNIKSGQGTSAILVDWNGPSTQKIGYVETNEFGCSGDTVWQNVYFDNLTLELNYVSTLPTNANVFELSWKVTSPVNLFKGQYQLYYRPTGTSTWNIYGGVPFTQTKATLDRLPTNLVYDFKVEALNNCNRISSTPPHQNVVITGQANKNQDVSLKWNNYKGWQNGVFAYELLKNKNGLLTPDQSAYYGPDTSQRLEFLLDEYQVCYRIISHERNGSNESYSNRYCLDLEPVLTMPNAFSPDLNGINDAFKAAGFAIKDFHMEIYNRWGERIFESNDINQGWDGTYKGKDAMDGMYIYVVRYAGGNGRINLLKGNLSLIR